MTADAIVAQVRSMFDTDDATVLGWVNERHRTMVAQSMWRQSSASLGATVAGQANYDLPADVVDLRRIRVDQGDGARMYDLASIEEMWQLDEGTAWLDGNRGVFASDASSGAVAQVRLYPAPEVDAAAITGLQALQADELLLGQSPADSPIIPVDFHRYLRDGAVADGYELLDERPDLADLHEQRFADGVERLRRRKNSRVGSGPVRIRIRRW